MPKYTAYSYHLGYFIGLTEVCLLNHGITFCTLHPHLHLIICTIPRVSPLTTPCFCICRIVFSLQVGVNLHSWRGRWSWRMMLLLTAQAYIALWLSCQSRHGLLRKKLLQHCVIYCTNTSSTQLK